MATRLRPNGVETGHSFASHLEPARRVFCTKSPITTMDTSIERDEGSNTESPTERKRRAPTVPQRGGCFILGIDSRSAASSSARIWALANAAEILSTASSRGWEPSCWDFGKKLKLARRPRTAVRPPASRAHVEVIHLTTSHSQERPQVKTIGKDHRRAAVSRCRLRWIPAKAVCQVALVPPDVYATTRTFVLSSLASLPLIGASSQP
jgi:hypothetical protein